ncbi:4-hydroxy-tetrahydrodipicolinate synthase [Coralloluteibacterium stylophorae]|uniref:4-hydroxy-tetrahydrodipicolinate synthase n=1 Tax=Coralloluteibacterium stylophorae TaxID=1776034 RepID=A0A8J8B1C8_9GAMM|nr:4-hydroxy-tetrahydrodipicolinate synthase [Coralloluteibacterium stylophorae]MBS7458707.1 4-hydroxy-tetrahydrodipicolinate synthase [Coralloluteibacterium stylophorae]
MRLTGSITALATPFDAAGALDLDAWKRLIAEQLEAGTQAVVVAGSTGEAATLDDAEYSTLLECAVAQCRGRVPVLAGTGLSGTARTVALTRRVAQAGVDAALVVTPPYVRPTQAGLRAHFEKVAEEGGLPVVLYNVPPRTGVDLLPDTVARLAAHANIVAIKEARAEPERMQALLALRGDGFSVLSGDDPTATRAMLAGADGVISVASNVVPRSFRRLCDLARAGDADSAAALDARLQPLYRFLSVEPNPIPVKALLARAGVGHGLRLPLTELAVAHADDADDIAHRVRALESE